ncbi:MAG: chromate transporter, partial [Alphaproteobacteria bacterium]|nr:chromate transporter [Alphaproteobacteria bacterium]
MKKFSSLLKKMFEVGCIGFGGGNALVPILEDAFVDENDNGETAKALDKDVVVANMTPGALPVEIVGSLGRRTHGIKGMFAAPLMFTLPGILGTLILMLLMSGLQQKTMNFVLVGAAGISAFICSLLIEYGCRVFKAAKDEGKSRVIKVAVLVIGVTVLIAGGSIYKLLGIERDPFFGVSTLSLLLAMFFWAFYVNTQHDFLHLGIGGILTIIYLIGSGKNELLSGSVGTIVFDVTKGLMIILAAFALVQSIRKSQIKMKVDGKSLLTDILLWVAFAFVLSLPSIIINHGSFE